MTAHGLVEVVLRWIHLVSGVLWIGLLYFFNLVNVPFQKELEADVKPKVNPKLMPRALFWFRWAALVTVLSGLLYFVEYILRPEPSSKLVFIWWALPLALTYAVVYSLLQPVKGTLNNGQAVFVIMAGLILVFSIVEVLLLQSVEAGPRSMSIALGGGYGIIMLLNVWGIIWRNQKKVLGLVQATPEEKTAAARRAFLASRMNAWLSLPMLFFMGAAFHAAWLWQ